MKKYFSFSLIICVILCFNYSVFATNDNITLNELSISAEEKLVTITGNVPTLAKGNNVNIKIENPDSGLQNIEMIKAGESGEFSYKFKISLDDKSISGDYKVTVFSKNCNSVSTSFYFPTDIDSNYAFESIINSAKSENYTTLLGLLLDKDKNFAQKLSFNTEVYKAVSKEEVSKLLYEDMKADALKAPSEKYYTSSGKMQKKVIEFSVITGYNSAVNSIIYTNNYDFLNQDVLNLNDLDKEYGVKAYDFYKNSLSEKGKKLVQEGLLHKNFKNLDSLKKLLIENICVYGINNPNKITYAHINILMKDLAKISMLSLTEYNALTTTEQAQVDQKISTTTINDKTSLQNSLNTFVEEIKKPNNDSGSGSYPSSGGGSHGGSGGIKVDSTTVSEVLDSAKNESPFSDMKDTLWALEAVKSLKARGIISGDGTQNFRPNDKVTREEFVKMIVCVMEYEIIEKDANMSDVDKDKWYSKYIATAVENGIISGYNDGTFGIGNSITREDAAVILDRASGKKDEQVKEVQLSFTDKDIISQYAKNAVANLTQSGVISGLTDGSFAPLGNLTRAQSAVMIHRFLLNSLKGE